MTFFPSPLTSVRFTLCFPFYHLYPSPIFPFIYLAVCLCFALLEFLTFCLLIIYTYFFDTHSLYFSFSHLPFFFFSPTLFPASILSVRFFEFLPFTFLFDYLIFLQVFPFALMLHVFASAETVYKVRSNALYSTLTFFPPFTSNRNEFNQFPLFKLPRVLGFFFDHFS